MWNFPSTQARGFSLLELLIVMAVLGIISAIAIPTYSGYLQSSRNDVARTNLQTLKLAEEAYFFDRNQYLEGTYNPGAGTDTLTGPLGWTPNADGRQFIYRVAVIACPPDATVTPCYTITVSGFNGKVNISETRK